MKFCSVQFDELLQQYVTKVDAQETCCIKHIKKHLKVGTQTAEQLLHFGVKHEYLIVDPDYPSLHKINPKKIPEPQSVA